MKCIKCGHDQQSATPYCEECGYYFNSDFCPLEHFFELFFYPLCYNVLKIARRYLWATATLLKTYARV